MDEPRTEPRRLAVRTRYLAGHGPATDRDLARWAGLPRRRARAGRRGIALDDREDGLVDLTGRPSWGGSLAGRS